MSGRHARDHFYITNLGQMRGAENRPASTAEQQGAFRFSEMVPRGTPMTTSTCCATIARAMVAAGNKQRDGDIPAGFTYLGQFIDHDLTMDPTKLDMTQSADLGAIENGRSPALDLDSLYGGQHGETLNKALYEPNGMKFRLGPSVRRRCRRTWTGPATASSTASTCRARAPAPRPAKPARR
jgi:hypothetical protein